MAGVHTLTHKSKQVVLVDLSGAKPETSVEVVPQAHGVIAKAGPKGALVLTDVTNATYNRDVSAAIKDFVSNNTPFIKASAVVGATGVRGVLLQTAIVITRREIKTFDNRPAALDWLASM